MFLISGGGSQLGLNTARALVERGERVVLTTRRRNDAAAQRVEAQSGGLATVEVLDLTNMYEILNLMGRYDFKRVIHTATAHMFAQTRAANYPSYEMLFNMLEASTSLGVERFVLCNSIVVYRGVEAPFHEEQDLPADFMSRKTNTGFDIVPPFEVTLKRIMEAITLDYGVPLKVWDRAPKVGGAPLKQMETAVIRYPAQAGPFYNSMYNPIACLVHAYVKRQPELMADRPLRAFVDISYSVDNADAAATVGSAASLPHRIYNASSGIHATGRQVLAAFYDAFPDAREILGLKVEDQAHAPTKVYLDISRIREDLGWTPKHDLSSMLKAYVAWVRENPF
ncbi:MAG: NAD(P)-dependent oxidoreductase [Caulobacteraceae bacterium]|nr:NAD(P)-dependent oxidoreductase [Caulobacteraceae bacterium]